MLLLSEENLLAIFLFSAPGKSTIRIYGNCFIPFLDIKIQFSKYFTKNYLLSFSKKVYFSA
jgi:hypothetical protein